MLPILDFNFMNFEHGSKNNKQVKKKESIFKFEIKILYYMGYHLGENLVFKISTIVQEDTNVLQIQDSNTNLKKIIFLFLFFSFIILYFYFNIIFSHTDELNIFELVLKVCDNSTLTSSGKKFYSVNAYFNSLIIELFKEFFSH